MKKHEKDKKHNDEEVYEVSTHIAWVTVCSVSREYMNKFIVVHSVS